MNNEPEILDEETASLFAQKRTEALEQMAQEELQAERLRLQQINRDVENKRQIELARKQEEENLLAEEEKRRLEQSKKELEEKARDAAQQAEDAVKKEAEHKEAMKAIFEAVGTKDTDDTVVSRLTKEATERAKKADRATELADAALKQIESLQNKVQQDAIREYSEGAVREMDLNVQVSDGKKIEVDDLTKDLGKQVEVNLLNVKLNEELEKYKKTDDKKEPKDLTEEEKNSLALTAEQWEERRSKSRALITSLMIDKWSMITDYCKGKHCRYSPLMFKDGVTQCVVCDGTGTGKDGYYHFELAESKNVEESSVPKAKTEATVDSIIEKSPVKTKDETVTVTVTVEAEKPVVVEEKKNLFAERLAEATQAQSFEQRIESDIAAPSKSVETVKTVEAPSSTPAPTPPAVSQTKPPLSSPPAVNTPSHNNMERSPSPSVSSVRSATPSVSSAVKKRIPTSGGAGGENESVDTESAEKRTFATKEIGRKMLKGWILLDDACPYCIMPLMTETKGSEHVCVLCGPLEAKHAEVKKQKETEDKIKERMKLEQELIQLKEKEEELKAIRLEEQKKREAALKVEADKKKAIEESKRMEEEKIKKIISEEVKRREEEIASELLETQTRYSAKASEDVESTKRATEKERLLKERQRFANVAKDIKKMEELHKLKPDIPPVPVSPITSPEPPSKTIAQTPNNVIESESILSKVSVSKRPSNSYTNTSFNDNESVASKVSVAKIDNGDEASTGGVSIQFPPDFDYDDEDAIRQVIAMARSTRAKSSAVASVNSGNTPPMSISFVEKKNNNVASPMKRTSHISDSPTRGNLIPKHILSEPKIIRKPMIPPSSSSVRSFAVEQDFDDGVSHMTMGTSFAASSPRVGSYMNKTNNKFTGGSPLSDLQENTASTSTSNNMNMMTPPIHTRRRSRSITRDTPPPPMMSSSSSTSGAAGRRSEALRKSSELLSRIDQHFSSGGSLSGGVPPSSRSRSVSRSRRVTTNSNSRSNSIDRRSSSLSRRRPSVGSSSRVISNMPDDIMNMKTKYSSNSNNLAGDDDAGSVGAGSVSSRVSAASQNLNDILKQIESAKSQLSKTTSTPKYSSYTTDMGNKSVATSNSKAGSNIMSKLEHAKMIEKLAADAVKIDNFEDEEFGL